MDARDIISDEESQALRNSDTSPSGLPAPAGQVQDLHADHWERILADRAPALDSIADCMVSLLKATGRRFLRSSPEVIAHPVRSVRWGAYARTLPAPTSLNVLEIRPAGSKGLIMLDTDFVFMLVDVFFGGDGRGKRPAEMTELTPIEQRLVRKFVEAVTSDLKQAWKPFLDLDFSLLRTESNPVFAGVAANAEMVSMARFAFMIGETEHCFDVILPATVIEPLRSFNEAGRNTGTAHKQVELWRDRLRQDVEGARVSLRAILSVTEISLRDIALARPGDVIHTELPANVVLYAGNQPLMEGALGVCQGRNAVRISKPVNRQALGAQHDRSRRNQ